jgi:hypothetical protein
MNTENHTAFQEEVAAVNERIGSRWDVERLFWVVSGYIFPIDLLPNS